MPIYANPDGRQETETIAKELGVSLAGGSFSWIGSMLINSAMTVPVILSIVTASIKIEEVWWVS